MLVHILRSSYRQLVITRGTTDEGSNTVSMLHGTEVNPL